MHDKVYKCVPYSFKESYRAEPKNKIYHICSSGDQNITLRRESLLDSDFKYHEHSSTQKNLMDKVNMRIIIIIHIMRLLRS